MPLERRIRFPAEASPCRVVVRRGALRSLGRITRDATGATRVALVTDPRVGSLYGAAALRSLRRAGLAADRITVPDGERAKSPVELVRLWDAFAALGIGRRDAVVALGGGVVGDLAGFAAATWLRGVRWVCAPTTLLAQADAGIGGKTAVDLADGKNLAGAFHHPSAVVADPDVLVTLPGRHLRAGLAEVAKMGMAVDAALFRWMERHAAALRRGEPARLEGAVVRAVAAKLQVVRRDVREREGGPRTALNYGHTLGHAIEAASGYRGTLHGEAVALGMRAAAELSERVAGLTPTARARQEALLDALGLPRRIRRVRMGPILRAMAHDKKRSNARIHWVLTTRIGRASVPRPIDSRLVRTVVLRLGAKA